MRQLRTQEGIMKAVITFCTRRKRRKPNTNYRINNVGNLVRKDNLKIIKLKR